MNAARKEKVKARLTERRKFHDVLRKMKKAADLAQKARLRLEPGTFRVTFSFGPEELGIDCKPTPESIEKLGLQRALERLDRQDFITTIALIARGEPDAENLARIRAEVLESTKNKVKKDGTLDLAAFGTTAGVSDETNSGPVTTTEL